MYSKIYCFVWKPQSIFNRAYVHKITIKRRRISQGIFKTVAKTSWSEKPYTSPCKYQTVLWFFVFFRDWFIWLCQTDGRCRKIIRAKFGWIKLVVLAYWLRVHNNTIYCCTDETSRWYYFASIFRFFFFNYFLLFFLSFLKFVCILTTTSLLSFWILRNLACDCLGLCLSFDFRTFANAKFPVLFFAGIKSRNSAVGPEKILGTNRIWCDSRFEERF